MITNEKENLLWYCREEVREFGKITEDTLEQCKNNGITQEEINEAIAHLGVTVTE